MILFEEVGSVNTVETIEIAIERAVQIDAPIVIASNEGKSCTKLIELMEAVGADVPVIAVTHVAGFKGPGIIEMPEEVKKMLENKGVKFVTAAHALSAGERALSNRVGGIYPLEVAAKTLRLFGQGVKVAVEISIMAMDAGLLEYGEPVVAIGGTSSGVDAAVLLTPSYTSSMFDMKIHEILCKPYFK